MPWGLKGGPQSRPLGPRGNGQSWTPDPSAWGAPLRACRFLSAVSEQSPLYPDLRKEHKEEDLGRVRARAPFGRTRRQQSALPAVIYYSARAQCESAEGTGRGQVGTAGKAAESSPSEVSQDTPALTGDDRCGVSPTREAAQRLRAHGFSGGKVGRGCWSCRQTAAESRVRMNHIVWAVWAQRASPSRECGDPPRAKFLGPALQAGFSKGSSHRGSDHSSLHRDSWGVKGGGRGVLFISSLLNVIS